MIKFENTKVVGWEAAIRGMRNPMNSWDKSDSYFNGDKGYCDNECQNKDDSCNEPCYHNVIGPKDMALMKNLRDAGTDHRKFMRMIIVYVDITAPLYWWKEFDTYKVGTVANSCSTMNKIQAKEFTLDDFSHEQLISNWINNNVESFVSFGDALNFEPKVDWSHGKEYNLNGGVLFSPKDILSLTIHALNACRQAFLTTKDKKFWWQMIQLLPSSYNQKRTVMMSYEVLANIYNSRKGHKLDEWDYPSLTEVYPENPGAFCRWIETLPCSELITVKEKRGVPFDLDSSKMPEPEEVKLYACGKEVPFNKTDLQQAQDISDLSKIEKLPTSPIMELWLEHEKRSEKENKDEN